MIGIVPRFLFVATVFFGAFSAGVRFYEWQTKPEACVASAPADVPWRGQ